MRCNIYTHFNFACKRRVTAAREPKVQCTHNNIDTYYDGISLGQIGHGGRALEY